jgi:choline dehydrogenase-like flavoprotein
MAGSAASTGAHYDIVIIGSGAGGASLAQSLADTGKRILILERGDHLERGPNNWNSTYVFVDRAYRTKELWYDKANKPFHPNTHYWVGGNTTFYGAALFRLRPGDFEEQRHAGGGVSPAWPVKYAEMAPYYLDAEKRWHVHGKRGVDPTEPGDEPDYFYPALKHDPTIATLETHFQSLGWKPAALPVGVLRDDANPPLSQCIRCKTCGGYPCLLSAKADARTIALDPILRMPNITLAPKRKVRRLETDPSGRTVQRILVDGPDGPEEYSGDIVVLAAGAVNTAAILLQSAQPGHETGLANGSDQVGRNYMFHTMTAMVSITADRFDAPFPKTMYVNDFYWKDPQGGFDHPMGHIQLLEHMDGHVLEGQVEEEGIPPFAIPDFLSGAAAERMLAFLCISEDLPSPDNRVHLDKDGRIHLDYTHGNLEGHKRLVQKLDHAMDRFSDNGSHGSLMHHHFQVSQMLPLYGTAHMCGTTRFGDDPKTSVLDRNCKAHQLDNLYITDASFFPSAAAVNPTLTIVANAWRVGRHLRERLGA